MSARDDILARLPADRREPFLQIVHDLAVPPDSPDLVQAYLAVEALGPLLDEVRGACDDISTAMRAAASEIVGRMSTDIAAETTQAIKDGVQDEIVANLSAQHDVALQAHDRARRAVENLEGELASHLSRIAAKSVSSLQQHGVLLPIGVLVLAFLLLVQIGGGDRISYGLGVSHERKAAAYSQFLRDAKLYRRNPLEWRAQAERAK